MIKLYLTERGHRVSDTAISFDQAIEVLDNNQLPDLILIDVLLSGKKSGIDLANFIQSKKLNVPFIFLTSYFNKDIMEKALKSKPDGYLTKPISKQTLWTTIESVYNRYYNDKEQASVIINDGKVKHKCYIDNIIYIESDHVYCNVALEDKSIVVRESLKELFANLNLFKFLRCHRSYVVNTKYIDTWSLHEIVLNNGKIIPVSRSYRKVVSETLEK